MMTILQAYVRLILLYHLVLAPMTLEGWEEAETRFLNPLRGPNHMRASCIMARKREHPLMWG